MAKKTLNAFELATDLPKKSNKRNYRKGKKRIEIPGDFNVATAIDSFVDIKKQINDLEFKLDTLEEIICEFGNKMYVKGCLVGDPDNPILQGIKEKVQFLTIDRYRKPILDTENKLKALGFNVDDLIEDSIQYILNTELLKDQKIKKKVAKALAEIHPNLLHKKVDRKIKDGTIKKLKDLGNSDVNKMLTLIKVLGVINYPIRTK